MTGPDPATAARWNSVRPGFPRHLAVFVLAVALAFPAFYHGAADRMTVFLTNNRSHVSPDTIGFVALAERGLHPFYGWREPLFPQMIAAVRAATGLGGWEAVNWICAVTSWLALPLVFWLGWVTAGPFAAVVAVHIVSRSAPHLHMIWFRDRTDTYLVLLLLTWLAMHYRRWFAVALLAALATYMRVTSWVTVGFTVVVWWAIYGLDRPLIARLRAAWAARTVRGTGVARGAACVALAAACIAPLLVYYARRFGDPLYPQTIVFYDYWCNTVQKYWLVNVTGDFERVYQIPAGWTYWKLFDGPADFAAKMMLGLRRLLVQFDDIRPPGFLEFSHPLFHVLYLAGGVLAALRKRGRELLAFLLGYTLPFLSLGFTPGLHQRFLLPTVTLGAILAGYAVQELGRVFGRLSARGGAADE